ncbi:MAG: CNNM domain-containing protein [Phycisphaerales bacterium JB039]
MADLGVTDTVLAALLPVLLAVSGMISGAETALFSLTHAERLRLGATHPRAARAVRRLFSQPRRLLIGILLINNAVNVVYFVISQALLWRIESGALRAALGLAALLTVIVVGEVLAKLLASAARERYAAVIAQPLAVVMAALGPALSGLDRWIVAPLVRLLRPRSLGPALAAEEMVALLEVSGAEGDLDDAEQSLLSAVLNLGEIRVRDVMRPRVDLDWIDADATPGQAREVAARSRARWLVVAARTLDDPQRRLLDVEAWLLAGAGAIRPVEPDYIPENARLDQLLEELRRVGSPVALAVDEQGQLSGLIHREDAIARLLEVSVADGAPGSEVVRMVGLNRWSVAGRLSIREWAEHFSDMAPQVGPSGRRVTTIAGLVMGALGRIPRVGDSVRIGPVLFTVESMRGRVVDRVVVDVGPEATP